MIQVCNITKKFNSNGQIITANDNVSLNIEKGDFIGLFGPNGSGKTTLVRQIMGIVDPCEGTIFVDGDEVKINKSRIKNKIGYMSQSLSAPIWNLTVREAVVISGQLKGLTKNQCLETLQYYKEYFELGDIDKRLVGSLSGGYRRIINFIIAVLGDRPLLILDEPTNDLDPYKRKLLWDKVKNLNCEGTTIILITHNVVEAENVVEQVAIMFNGKLIVSGTPQLLIKHVEDKIKLELVSFNIDYLKKAIGEHEKSFSDLTLLEESNEKLVYLFPKEYLSYIISFIDSTNCITDYNFSRISLEEVYFKLYKEKLRGY